MEKIILISRGWYPYVKGGADRFIESLAYYLSSRGYDVLGVTRVFRRKHNYDLDKPYDLYLIKQSMDIPLLSSIDFSIRASKIVNKLKPNIVIINQYWAESSAIFIKNNIPKIIVIHDIGFLKTNKGLRQNIINALRLYVLQRSIRKAVKIVVPTVVVKKDLVHYIHVDRDKIIAIGKEGVYGPMKFVHRPNDNFDIVQVARFAPNKGHLITLKAFKKIIHVIPEARLWLIGGRPVTRKCKQYFSKVLELAENINKSIGDNVVRIVIDAPDVSKYYELADVCVASSTHEEGYGLAIAECMAYGKPVVVSDIFKETGVAREDRALIYRRGNYEELAKQVIRLYRDKELYERLSKKGLEYAKSASWNRVADIFEEIIKELVGTRGRSRKWRR